MSQDHHLQPYRIEWQAHHRVHWTLVTSCDDHDEALSAAEAQVEKYGGFARVVSQHVIHRAQNLGARAAS